MRINTIAVVREFFNIKNKTQLTKATTFDGFFYSHVNHIVLNSPRGIRISPYPWRTDCCCCLWIHNLCWGASLPACLPSSTVTVWPPVFTNFFSLGLFFFSLALLLFVYSCLEFDSLQSFSMGDWDSWSLAKSSHSFSTSSAAAAAAVVD